MGIVLNEHEKAFRLYPVGIAYVCEFCNEGEMEVDTSEPTLMSNPPLIPHKCTKCGKTMHLPKSYPFVKYEKNPE